MVLEQASGTSLCSSATSVETFHKKRGVPASQKKPHIKYRHGKHALQENTIIERVSRKVPACF